MPRLYDRRSGRYLGKLSEHECNRLMSLFEEPGREDDPIPLDPELIERWAEAGASDLLLSILQQLLEGSDDFDLDWEPDAP
ncbi:hypothetical protein [Marilutibacter chinensis]|uniref:Uncharacterized protein n=1 Tax=Marilutibacter chinensis TaxID=2912247 RepID=A0ABS9HMW4_9GAMM|nr:hypothetical protein [Lysobacter chinensis]MCF7220356.1 hypothetical protein [Lysobacter chinensis]